MVVILHWHAIYVFMQGFVSLKQRTRKMNKILHSFLHIKNYKNEDKLKAPINSMKLRTLSVQERHRGQVPSLR